MRVTRAREAAHFTPAEGATRPPNEKSAGEQRKNRGAETENAQLFDRRGAAGAKAAEHGESPRADAKKKRASGGGIAKDFVTLSRKRDTPPSGADFRLHSSDRLPQCDETLPPRLSP